MTNTRESGKSLGCDYAEVMPAEKPSVPHCHSGHQLTALGRGYMTKKLSSELKTIPRSTGARQMLA